MLKRRKVLIIHRILAPYRIPFYNRLREVLLVNDIDLFVVYGSPRTNETDPYADLDFGIKVKTKYIYFNDRFLVWLSALKYVVSCDLVIVQQANTNLINYLLIPLRKIVGFKLAFWGHGKNFQAVVGKSFGERFKRLYSTHVDHWFAYTNLSKKVLVDLGFPEQNITVVNNAIDTSVERKIYEEISQEELDELKTEYGITKNDAMGIFCSRIYKDKRIDFLIGCVEKVKQRVGSFHFFIIGDGEDVGKVINYATDHSSWFHWVGPRYGRDKIKFFKLAKFQLMPGLVGLHVVDSFSMLKPLVTTDIEYHSPEIIYLKNGFNGVITEDNEEAYVSGIINLLGNPSALDTLVAGCRVARDEYTIENMAGRYAAGICRALSMQGSL